MNDEPGFEHLWFRWFYWSKPGVCVGPRGAAVIKGNQSAAVCPPSPSGPLFLLAEDVRRDNEKLGFTAASAGLGAQLSSVQKILLLIQN